MSSPRLRLWAIEKRLGDALLRLEFALDEMDRERQEARRLSQNLSSSRKEFRREEDRWFIGTVRAVRDSLTETRKMLKRRVERE